MTLMTKTKSIVLPPLPYAEDALAPTMSARTMGLHYGKHHRGYVDKLNALIDGTRFAGTTLEEIIKATHRNAQQKAIFNNAAQAWNHMFFWNSLRPSGGEPSGMLAKAIDRDFGGYETFLKQFVDTGAQHFGSGWVWLVAGKDKLAIEATADAVTPMAEGKTCLLTIDVWEHAYYLDYQNRRPDFLKAVAENLLNWEFAAKNLAGA
jgi:Fe-Mn family superoxide dismutase